MSIDELYVQKFDCALKGACNLTILSQPFQFMGFFFSAEAEVTVKKTTVAEKKTAESTTGEELPASIVSQ